MGGSAFQSGTLGGIPSLPSVLDFLAANWLQEADLNRRYTAYEAAVLPLHHPAMCRGLTVPRRYKNGDMSPSGVGADSGNRTHVFGLEGRRSAVELHPHIGAGGWARTNTIGRFRFAGWAPFPRPTYRQCDADTSPAALPIELRPRVPPKGLVKGECMPPVYSRLSGNKI